MCEQRITELEIKIAYQEDLLQELNTIVAHQQQSLMALEKVCRLLYERLDNIATGQIDSIIDEPPPHY